MRYAKKVIMVPHTEQNNFLNTLDVKMGKILTQRLPVDEKVKLYNQALETYLINVPEKQDPKIRLHEEDRSFIVENQPKPIEKSLNIEDRQFIAEKVNEVIENLRQEKRQANKPKRKARQEVVENQRDPVISQDIDLENIVEGTRKRRPAVDLYRQTLHANFAKKRATKKTNNSNDETHYTDAEDHLNQTGNGWITGKNYFL